MGRRAKKKPPNTTAQSFTALTPKGSKGPSKDSVTAVTDGSHASQQTAKDDPTAKSTLFGFDHVCTRCTKLYRLKISGLALDESQTADTSRYVGNLAHIRADARCGMCRGLFEMRWSDSAAGVYQLHALSAARVLCGQSIKVLSARLSTSRHACPLTDGVLLAVVPDDRDPILLSRAIGKSKSKGFLLACKTPSYEELGWPMVKEADFIEDDRDHKIWLDWEIENRQKYSQTKIKVALQQAQKTGFINEYKEDDFLRWGVVFRNIDFTSVEDLKQRDALGEKYVGLLSLQPIETGNPNTPEKLGYVPHSICSKGKNPVQSLASESFFGRVTRDDTIDYSLIRGWIRQCLRRCESSLEDCVKERKRFQKIPFLLLDCHKNKLLKVPAKRNHCYVALSYVWGDIGDDSFPLVSELSSTPPESYPTVIKDAMTVVLELGYRYLWIDRLCISQEASSRLEQIANLDTIYKNAELTIVAAAGDNAQYGLPGVGDRRKLPQTHIEVGDHLYVSTGPDPAYTFDRSVYQTRGWTYQEFFYSRRRLVFSDYGVSFACRSFCDEIHYQESICCPSGNLPTFARIPDQLEDQSVDDVYFRRLPITAGARIFKADGTVEECNISLTDKIFALLSFAYHVSQFTKRKISFESDSLQAVSGILDRFAYRAHSIYHVYGIPFIPSSLLHGEVNKHHFFDFKYGLLWTHGPRYETVNRRPAFPSWSWAGWEGQVDWLIGSTRLEHYYKSSDSNANFSFLSTANSAKGKLLPIKNWRPNTQKGLMPDALVFSGVLYNIPLRFKDGTCGLDKGIYLDTSDVHCRSRLHVTQIELEAGLMARKKLQGLWLGTTGYSLRHVLVLQEVTSRGTRFGGRYFERVGVMSISFSWSGWKAPLGLQAWLV